MNAPGPQCYAFDGFQLDPLRGQLSNGGGSVGLRPKSLAVLEYLVAHPQRVVGKDELMDAVWGKVVVTEDSLVQCVREIRQALGDADQRIVRTIPRGGYLFVPRVTQQPPEASGGSVQDHSQAPESPGGAWQEHDRAPQSSAGRQLLRAGRAAAGTVALLVVMAGAWIVFGRSSDPHGSNGAARTTPSAPPMSIVVLPLVMIDGDPTQQYFADGLTSDLTTDLGRIPTSLVISHNSAKAYRGTQIEAKAAGRELGVRYALEGSVQRLHDDVRVNLRLIDTETGAQRWAERFEGHRTTLAQMQADIVRRIAHTLELRLLEAEAARSGREHSNNPDAQELVMRGWALWDRRRAADNVQARAFFTQATLVDPKSSLAWVGMANTHLADLHASWSDDRQKSLREADAAVAQAHAIGPRHREVNAGRGYVLFFQGDIETALAAFDQEIDTNPGNALAHVWRGLMLISLARPAEAVPSIDRGIALSPRDVDLNVSYRSMAHAHFSLGRYDEAVGWSRNAVGHTPTYAKGYAFLAASAALAGDNAAAASAIEAFRRLQPRYDSVVAFRQSMMPGEVRMFDSTPRFWEGLAKAGLSGL
jgi:TolB-like protein/DNA-binding winged helix-turn-helix (wHTH) protein/Tfp pilus assembly protein PilF